VVVRINQLLRRSFRVKVIRFESHPNCIPFIPNDASTDDELQTPHAIKQGRPCDFEHDLPSVRKRAVGFEQYSPRAYVDSPPRSGLRDDVPVEEFVMNVEPEGIPAILSTVFGLRNKSRNTEHSASYHPRVDVSSRTLSIRYGRGGSRSCQMAFVFYTESAPRTEFRVPVADLTLSFQDFGSRSRCVR